MISIDILDVISRVLVAMSSMLPNFQIISQDHNEKSSNVEFKMNNKDYFLKLDQVERDLLYDIDTVSESDIVSHFGSDYESLGSDFN